MRKKTCFRALQALLCLVLTVCLLGGEITPVLAVTQAEIDALKEDAGDLTAQRKELEQELKGLKNDRAEVVRRKNLLDQQIANTSQQITNIETQISKYEELIAQSEQELADAEAREKKQYELFCRRVREMEEQGNMNYWTFLFGAVSFSDLLGRLDAVNEIMDYDQGVVDSLKTLQAEIAEKKTGLEGSKAEQEAAKAEVEAVKAELDAQRAEANALITEIRNNEAQYASAIDELEREEEAILQEILRKSRELAAQQGGSASSGGYIWPVDSRYITSTVGGRTSPGGIGSTNHKGTDIGRVGYNSKIYAAKAGTVIVSQYSSSYGNYVVISHGSGNTTLYGHMSSRKVKVNDYVNQGDVIGITGSTGNSTGPHLHFEITENGERINPLSHGKQPCKGYLSGYTLSGTSIGK